MRIGHGYDVHRLEAGRKLILCGVEIENGGIGLAGHSDADVVCHALADALLGALALGDIGSHFPDTDKKYKGISSILLLKEVINLLSGYVIENVDITIIAQAPKLLPYRQQMRQNIASIINIPLDCVSIKATTEEGLGFTGQKKGIACHAVCLLK